MACFWHAGFWGTQVLFCHAGVFVLPRRGVCFGTQRRRGFGVFLLQSFWARRGAAPNPLRLCVLKIISACPQKLLREMHTPSHVFFLTRMARIFRNYHPAHLDTTEHRVAMGGWYGNLHAFTSILHYSSGHRPSDAILSSTSKMRSSQPSAALRAKNNFRVPPKILRQITTTSHVFLTQMARNFRKCHPSPRSSPTPKGLNV